MASRWGMNRPDRRIESPNESGSSPKKNRRHASEFDNYQRNYGPKPYSFTEIAKATAHFSVHNLIGHGISGQVYKGFLDGKIFAIKKLSNLWDIQSGGNLEREIMITSSLSHKNLIKLIGYCFEGADRLLVLNYFPNKSLKYKLHEKENVLDWKKRMNIAIGSAKGLEYLHEHCEFKIIHSNIKSDNIFIDDNFEPKISDVGFAIFFMEAATHISRSFTQGTQVYADLWIKQFGKYSDKSDIYSFGVVLLELITGRELINHKGINIITWAKPLIERALNGEYGDFIEKALNGEYGDFIDFRLESFDYEEMHRVIFCINICIYQPSKFRPSIRKILLALEGILPLSALCEEKNVIAYTLRRVAISKDDESSSYFEEENETEDENQIEEDNETEKENETEDEDQIEEESEIEDEDQIEEESEIEEEDQVNNLKHYAYNELVDATNFFSNNEILGEGASGAVYKGKLGEEFVAIKKFKIVVDEEQENFEGQFEEIDVLKRVRHPNVVKLVGYCNEGKNKLLVLEYLPNKSLKSYLHGKILDWSNRLNIAIGSAKGILYLHKCDIIHRDIKTDNILLDNNLEPKIADFSLSKFFPNTDNVTHITSVLKGTDIYLDPEHDSIQKVSVNSDIYSFGVVLLELITGRRIINRQENVDIVKWAQREIEKAFGNGEYTAAVKSILQSYDEEKIKRMIMALVDSKLANNYDEEQMKRMIFCAIACLNKSSKSRPPMQKIIKVLEGKIIPPQKILDCKTNKSIKYSRFRNN